MECVGRKEMTMIDDDHDKLWQCHCCKKIFHIDSDQGCDDDYFDICDDCWYIESKKSESKHKRKRQKYLTKYTSILTIYYLLSGCTIIPNPVPPEPLDGTCQEAAARLVELECIDILTIAGPDEEPNTKDDPTWLSWCNHVSKGPMKPPVGCYQTAESCEAAKGCR
jgi:hypothetical protein